MRHLHERGSSACVRLPGAGTSVAGSLTDREKVVKHTTVAAGAGVVIAVAAVATLGIAYSSEESRPEAGDTTITQDDGSSDLCINTGDNSQVNCAPKPADQLNEEKVLSGAEAAKAAGRAPTGAGPWPFVVTQDLGKGLKVRTTNVTEGVHIGALAHLNTAYVVCGKRSGFDPEGNGDLWYKVKWDHQQPNSTDYFESEPGATGSGWAYGHYLSPVNHNGEVPAC
jgi:hypothetical protein